MKVDVMTLRGIYMVFKYISYNSNRDIYRVQCVYNKVNLYVIVVSLMKNLDV